MMGDQRIPTTGNRVEVTGINVDRLEGGKIVGSWSEFDALGMMQQLGLIAESGYADVGQG
jgi:predicted ester cyclase